MPTSVGDRVGRVVGTAGVALGALFAVLLVVHDGRRQPAVDAGVGEDGQDC